MIRRKSNLRSRYVGRHDGAYGERRTQEDEVTSLMLGILRYQPPAIVWAIMKAWLLGLGDGAYAALSALAGDRLECKVQFWPRINNVEPDVVIDFVLDHKTVFRIVIEAKWNAGESGNGQFKKQRQEFEGGASPSTFVHLALLKSRVNLPPAIEDGAFCVVRTTWAEYVDAVGRAAANQNANSAHLLALAYDLQKMLSLLQLTREFSGIKLNNFFGSVPIPRSLRFFSPWSSAATIGHKYNVQIRDWLFYQKGNENGQRKAS